MRKQNYNTYLFLTGLFSMTEIYIGGFCAISELVLFIIGPFVFIKDLASLKKDGFMPFIWLLLLTMLGCVISSLANATIFSAFAKGFAALYGTFVAFICVHRWLRNDFTSVKWYFLGYALSFVVNIFIFQRGSSRHLGDAALISYDAMESTINSVIFWATRLPQWLYLPIRGWYMSTPTLYSAAAALVVTVISLFGSGGSGRSAALCAICTFGLLIMGRKTFRGMMALKKHIFIMFMFLIALASLGKMAYNRLASGGTLGAVAAKKFEQQTKQGSGVVSMLVAGRGEFFSGLYCICRKPIVGYGPWAIDWNGLSVEFLRKYGSPEDYELYVKSLIREGERRIAVVPTHSCVVGFWVWYGIFGLLFWIYILYLYWKTITNYFVTYPPWFGCIATILPNAVWDAFFSPYGNRVTMALFFAMCLFLKAVHEKRIPPGGIVGFYQPMEWK